MRNTTLIQPRMVLNHLYSLRSTTVVRRNTRKGESEEVAIIYPPLCQYSYYKGMAYVYFNVKVTFLSQSRLFSKRIIHSKN